MSSKQYKVVREVEPGGFFNTYSEYKDYRMYLMEIPSHNSYSRSHQYMLTRENFKSGQTVMIDEGSEVLAVREGSNIHLGGNRVVVYRPERYVDEDFEIVSFANDGQPIEKFGSQSMERSVYNLYNAKREARNGYKEDLVRVFTKAAYAKGMRIPVNETTALPIRTTGEKPHFVHDTSCQAYIDRVWRAVRNAC